ncbi:hypothetical protein [Plesiomonas shigelloides]|uniref:hypothetical protein n=1 Tax=Plesiomonas shigelloides TaxID=703 RepID=UPI0032618F20
MKIKTLTVLFFSAVLMIMFLTYIFLNSAPERGTFGDMFGVANALFTGLALAAAGLAVYIQSIQLKETKESIEKSEALQLGSLNTQKKILEIQRLESIVSIKLKEIEIKTLLQDRSRGMTSELENELKALIDRIEKE